MSKSKNHRWTEAHAREVMERADNRDLSDSALARKVGVSPQRINWWRKRLRSAPGRPTPAFVEVKLAATMTHRPFTVHTGNGITIEVWPGFDSTELGRLITVMEKGC